MTQELEPQALRKVAEVATPGPWEIDGPDHPGPDDTLALHNNDGGAIAYVQPLWDDAEFIATFDPPTVLAILSRLEQAERMNESFARDVNDLNRELESLRTRFKGMRASRDSERSRADKNAHKLEQGEQAEQAVARVRELNQFLPASIMERITRALDGDPNE